MNTRSAALGAVMVRDGKIELAGASAEALAKAGAGHRRVDLADKTLLPSIFDAHSPYINSLLIANPCELCAPPSGAARDARASSPN